MPNPYGMTEVDVPGILAGYENLQDRRVQRMMAERQMQMQDRQLEQQDRAAAAWAKFNQGRQAASGGVSGAAGAYETPRGAQTPAQPAQQPQAAEYDPWDDPAAQQELLASLSGAIPMSEVMQIRQAFKTHSKEQREEAAANWDQLARAFFNLRQIPAAERPAAFQQMLPMLRALEIPDEMLVQPDLSDRGLEWGVDQARDIEKLITGRTPDVQSVPGVGLFPVTPGSPFPDFGNGGARPEAQIGTPAITDGATATNPETGEKIIYRNGQWEPAGGASGNAGGGFPGY